MGPDSAQCHLIAPDEFKKSLGPAAQNMTREQIEQLRQVQDLIAEAIFNSRHKGKDVPAVQIETKVEEW